MNRQLFYFIPLCISLLSCTNIRTNKNCSNLQDTLKVCSQLKTEEINLEIVNTFYSKFGIVIPKYYLINDSLSIDLNNDSILDRLVIFSPISLEDISYSDMKIENSPSRILVEIINCQGRQKIRNIYSNLISNEGGVLSKYSGMFKIKNGFGLRHEAGSRYSWTYFTEFSTGQGDSIYLIKIRKICSFEGHEKINEYPYANINLKELNINDTLKSNCNCDKLWLNLEKEYE